MLYCHNGRIVGSEANSRHDCDLQVLHEVKTLAKGVTGVPFFIIDGKHSLSGAQESETFVKMFEKL
jgi:predicted DsbA family dithiol-disulfide isomerase